MFRGFDDDFLSAGNGDDELYDSHEGSVLQGGAGTNYFDCGTRLNMEGGFNPTKEMQRKPWENVIQNLKAFSVHHL